MNFQNQLEKEITGDDYNKSITENGAIGYRTSGKALLDMNFKTSSYRGTDENKILEDWIEAWNENKELAIKWLFFARDIRGGMGEKRLFQVIFKYMLTSHADEIKHLIPYIAEYGSFKDYRFINLPLAMNFIKDVLNEDLKNMNAGCPISLLGKWLPRINTSSKETRRFAMIVANGLDMSAPEYRKTCSKLNKYLNTVEILISANEWDKVKYESVPSKANLKLANAFLKHDYDRRTKYLENPNSVIKTATNYPHDILHGLLFNKDSATMEKMWKQLPDVVMDNTIVVADGSGSMTSGNTNVSPLVIANALAIYFAERNKGVFKNSYITFSENPQIVKFCDNNTLEEKWKIARKHCEVANTNIKAVFRLILDTAIKNNVKQEELPKNILILSDMEFDHAVTAGTNSRLFTNIGEEYEKAGYKLPKLIFWNLCSRTETIPIKENDLGVALVSGFSPMIVDMVMTSKTDPYMILVEKLMSKRYEPITLTSFTHKEE
jgi:hypothetical protein